MENFIKKYKSEVNNLFYLLLSFFITFILHIQFIIINKTQLYDYYSIIDFGKTIFIDNNFLDIFAFVAIFLLIRYVFSNDKKLDKTAFNLSVIFSISYVVLSSYSLFNSIDFIRKTNLQVFLSIAFLIGYFIIFYVSLKGLFIFLDKQNLKLNKNKNNDFLHKHLFPVGVILIFTCWTFWLILSYPGSLFYDSNWQIKQFFGIMPYTTHHPPLSTFIMGTCYFIGSHLINDSFGVFLYCFLQTIIGAFIFSYGTNQLYKKGISLKYCYVVILFFTLLPLWGGCAQWFNKDLLYVEIITLFLFYVIDIIIKKDITKKDAIILSITALLSTLLRNNGIYAILPTLIFLIFYINKKSAKKLISASLIIISILFILITKVLYIEILDMKKGSKMEMLAIPIQQTARYVVNHSDDVSDYKKSVIGDVFKYDLIPSYYWPTSSDGIKFNACNNCRNKEALNKYYGVWFSMFFKHPGTYTSALLNKSYGYIAPIKPATDIVIDIQHETKYYDYIATKTHKSFEKASKLLCALYSISINAPIIKYLNMPGTYSWILFICMSILIRKKKYFSLIIFIPLIINILVCIASPLANSIRYMLPVAAVTPFLIGWTYYFIAKKKK